MVYEHHRSKISVNILSEIMFMVTILKKKKINNADNTSTVNSKSEKMCITVSHIYNTSCQNTSTQAFQLYRIKVLQSVITQQL